MKKILVITIMLINILFVGLAMSVDTMEIQNEIKDYEKNRADIQVEIDKLKIKLEKTINVIKQDKMKIQELQFKLDAVK